MDRIAAIRHDVDDSRGTCCWRPDNAHYPTRDGDFYLLAAAFGLFAACGSAIWVLNNRHNKDSHQWEVYARAAEDDLRAAIAKAKGDEVEVER